MRNFSIYRGQSRTGIGEGPANPPVPQGEQYLAADGPLTADGELLTAARPWMTPDWRVTDEQELGERIEAWSYFRHGPLRLIVRLGAAGFYDRRTAYFAHGRAFLAEELAGACDPGAYLGCSEAFDEPWRDGQRPAAKILPPPELVRPDQIQSEPGVAGALLAHLYQGIVSGYPIVVAVPVTEFQAGAPIHALVSFARAALPLALKIDCRLRVFTRLPELFLRHLRADLIVIPEKEAGDALAARRDATLLDRKGVCRAGREISREAADYAEAVLRRFMAFKGSGLLAFSGAISEHLPKDRLPAEQEIARIPALYNFVVARTDPARLGEWLRSSLLKKVDDRPTGLPWERLIRPEDWRAISFDDLAEILLTETGGEEARGLVQRAEAEARQPERREQISEERLRSRLKELPAERRPALLAHLLGDPKVGRPLIASDVAARLSSSFSTAELLASGAVSPLFAAELATGLLGQRARDVAGLAAAARESEVAGILARATSAGKLSPDWALRLLEEAGEPAVVQAAAEILPEAMDSLPWQPALQPLFDRLLALSSLPASLQAPLTAALHRADPSDPASGLHHWLVLTELLVRSKAPKANGAVEDVWRAAEMLADAADRRDFIRKVANPDWQSLQPDRLVSMEGRFSPSWAESFTDLLLQSEEVRDQLSIAALLKLADGRPEIGSWLDPRMRSDLRETTAALLDTGRWPLWRSRSSLDPTDLHQAARAWLNSEIWTKKSAPQARLEDWKQVMSDLRELSAEELRSLFTGRPPRPLWPWITPFQDEQLKDLSQAAQSDLGVLAELAESLDPERDLKYPLDGKIFEHVLALADPPCRGDLPGNVLAYLAESPRTVPPALSPGQVTLLYDQTRHRQERAAAAVRQSVKAFLDRDPLAALRAADRLPEWDRDLQGTVQQWQDKHSQEAQKGEIGEILGRKLPSASVPIGQASPARLDTEPALAALARSRADDGCWKRLEKEILEYVKAQARKQHPVSRLADSLYRLLPNLAEGERKLLERKGWDTLVAVAKSHPLILREPLQKGTALPALELAALLLPRQGLGRIALQLLRLEVARSYAGQRDWWDSLLMGMRLARCRDGLREPGDREEAALSLIHQAIPELFPGRHDTLVMLAMVGQRLERIYAERGVDLARNLIQRVTDHAGAAR